MNDADTLKRIRVLEAAIKRLTAQGVRCMHCLHLAHCAKKPVPTDEICICFEIKVVDNGNR